MSFRARGPLNRIARDRALGTALGEGDAAEVRARVRALARRYDVEAIAAYSTSGRRVAFTGDPAAVAPAVARPANEDRGRFAEVPEAVGPPVWVGAFVPGEEISEAVADSRRLIGAILAAFLLL